MRPQGLSIARRQWIQQGAAVCGGLLALGVQAANAPDALGDAVRRFTGGRPVAPGPVGLDIAELVENGGTVPVVLRADPVDGSPVRRLAMLTERNPQPDVAVFQFPSPLVPAWVSTRIRLATSQKVLLVAETADGRFWSREQAVVVTLAACLEGE